MMSMQARVMFDPYKNCHQTLRAYATNSPRAKARLLALSMLIDGHLDDAEIENLSKRITLEKLGIARETLNEVLSDFCSDLRSLPSDSSDFLLSSSVLKQLFDEITSAEERRELLALIFDMIRSDKHLADSESRLFWHAIDQWQLDAEDVDMALHGRRPHRGMMHPKTVERMK